MSQNISFGLKFSTFFNYFIYWVFYLKKIEFGDLLNWRLIFDDPVCFSDITRQFLYVAILELLLL